VAEPDAEKLATALRAMKMAGCPAKAVVCQPDGNVVLWVEATGDPISLPEALDHVRGPTPANLHQAATHERLAWSVKDLADAIGVSKSTVWRMIGDQKIKSFRLGTRTLVRNEEVVRYLSTK
jgi:excisionase family DNA binding protein